LGIKSGREADHSPPSSAEVKEWVELYLRSPNTPSCRGAQLGGAQGQLYLTATLLLAVKNEVSTAGVKQNKIRCENHIEWQISKDLGLFPDTVRP
jgi:hypothetical protein